MEDRILDTEQDLAGLLMLARARSNSADLSLPEEVEAAGWSAIDASLYDVLANLWAIQRVLPADVFGLDGPAA